MLKSFIWPEVKNLDEMSHSYPISYLYIQMNEKQMKHWMRCYSTSLSNKMSNRTLRWMRWWNELQDLGEALGYIWYFSKQVIYAISIYIHGNCGSLKWVHFICSLPRVSNKALLKSRGKDNRASPCGLFYRFLFVQHINLIYIIIKIWFIRLFYISFCEDDNIIRMSKFKIRPNFLTVGTLYILLNCFLRQVLPNLLLRMG